MNAKSIGEKGQNIVIGELAKWNIPLGFMLTDNLPFELVAYVNSKLFRIQVKTTARKGTACATGCVFFDLTTNNWLQKTVKKYTKEDCDVIICCDLNTYNIYLLTPDNFENKKSFQFRTKQSKNNQKKGINYHEDFIISEKRINEVFV